MPQVNKRIDFNSQYNNGCSVSSIKGEAFLVNYIYTTRDYSSISFSYDGTIPKNATNFVVHVYFPSAASEGTYLNVNGRDSGLLSGSGWLEYTPQSIVNSYNFASYGYSMQYSNNYYLCGINSNYKPYITYTIVEPSISSLSVTGSNIDQQLVVNYSVQDATSLVLQVIKGSDTLINVDVSGTNQYIIPANTLHYNGDYTFRLVATRNGISVEDTEVKSLSLTKPVISSVTLSSSNVERGTNITTSILGTNIDSYTVDILNSDETVIASNVGSTFSTGTLEQGSYKAKINAIHSNGYISEYNTEKKNFSIYQTNPTISSASLSTTNTERGNDITATATGTNITGLKVDIYDTNNNPILQNQNSTFNTLSLLAGTYKAKIKAYYDNGYYTSWSYYSDITFAIYSYDAQITSVYPNATRETRSRSISIGFSAKNFVSFSISVTQNGVQKYSNSGTNASSPDEIVTKSFSLIAGLLNIGDAAVNVTITNSRNGYSSSDSMSSTFSVIDVPNTPTITYESSYSNPKPTVIISNTSEYVSYKTCVDEVESSEVFGAITSYYFSTPLTNNEYHTFKVKVKNTYGLWSGLASATFYISYAELETPDISVYVDEQNGCICVAMESKTQENFASHSVLRLENSQWVEIGKMLERVCTFYDDSCASQTNYAYKVRAYDIYGGYKDSEEVEMSITFTGTYISVPWTSRKLKIEYYSKEDDISRTTSINNGDTYQYVCGLSKPKFFKGNIDDKSFSLSVAFKEKNKYDEFLNLIKEDILLFRDGKGEKIYCHISFNGHSNYINYYRSVEVNVQEVYYKEGDFAEVKDKPFVWATKEF